MATSRTYPPAVNLKERIAALQQRNVSPSQQQTSQFAVKNIPSSGPGGLRDKIAKFEEKGGIPVPRGSFGMGGPQLPENAPAKKRGELYGNRIQGLGRPIGTPPSRSCSPILPTDDSPSPSPRKRCVSTGGALLNGTPPRLTIHEPAPPLPPTPSLPSARRNSLAVDFGPAKRVINSDEISRHAVEDCESFPPSPSLSPSLRVGATFDIVSSSQSSLEPVTPKDSLPQDVEVLSPAEKEPEAPELVLQDGSNLAPAIALDMMTTSQFSPEIIPVFEVTSTVEPDQDNSPTSEELSERLQYPALSVDASPSDSQPPEAALPVTTTSQCSLRAIPIVEAPPTDQTDSPISDELSQASHHPVLPVDISMSDAPPSAAMLHVTAITQSPLRIVPVVEASFAGEPDQASDPGSDELSQTSHHPALSADTSISDVQPPEVALPGSPSKASSFARTSSLDAPTEDDSALSHSLVSIIDASESTAAANKEHDEVPSTSEFPNTEERGTISINVPYPKIQVQSSPPSPDMNTEIIKAEVKRSFTAVVHRKVTEMPAAKAPSSTLSAFMTPQIARVQRMGITISAEPAPSPSYGELATLLEEAALLEMRLTEGDIVTPSESLQVVPSKTPTNSTFPTDVRSASSSTLTEHVKAPSTDSASISGRSVSIPSIREPNISGNIPEEDEVDGRSLASTSASQRSPSHKKYLSSIRRLTSRRSSNYMPGAYPRDSISTCSEDSAAIATPSDHGDGSGEGFGIAWPSVSPKKGSMGRSSSFADKLFNRNRTKSNVSTVETDQGSIYNSSGRSFTLSQPPSPAKNSQGRHASDVQSSRSSPWTISRDSSSSSPSPSILDKEIFDAFPSVPQTLPPGPVHLSPDFSEVSVRRLSAIPVKGRKHQQQQRLSMV